jgi:Ca2+-binding EF-hand superfamily protein
MNSNKIDWTLVRKKLCLERDEKGLAKRNKMWASFDVNGNGYLSLAELDKGIRDVLNMQDIFEIKPVIMRAYQAARNTGKTRTKHSEDYVERNEFRVFLVYLRQYFEYWEMFERIDQNNDRKVTLSEFKHAVPTMEKWGVKISSPEANFAEVDANGGGVILFDEFCHWAIKKSLDLEDDEDFEDVVFAKLK